MTPIFIYKIDGLTKSPSLNGFNDVVTKVAFTIYAQAEDGTQTWHPLVIPMTAPEAGSETFIALESLTEEEVISWIEPNYPMDPIKDMLTKQLDDIVNPKEVVTELPWVTPENI